MNKKLIIAEDLKKYFLDRGYNCIKPHQIVNNHDTVFVTAGIQPILSEFRDQTISNTKKIYLSQPVIRTQFVNSISEGSSIAFINSTTAGFNISEENHNELVKDWLNLFQELGMNYQKIYSRSKDYERKWGDLTVSGKKTFYYYNNIELGDTTFFTKVLKNEENVGIDTMSDVGFGLERIRWCINNQSYFDLYSDSQDIQPEIKAYLSAIALLAVNEVKPSNKNAGYRARLFSKKLVGLLEANDFTENVQDYLLQCIEYWKSWQEINKNIDISIIQNEYIRNCNRYIIDKLTNEGYKNLSGININISKKELKKRLISSNVELEKIKKMMK